MGLTNLKTGQTISEMKSSGTKDELIAQQATQIFSLTSQVSELKAIADGVPKLMNMIESLKESVSENVTAREEAEARAEKAEEELERERKTQHIEVRYWDRCVKCPKQEYERKAEEASKDRDEAAAERKKTATELAEAEKIRQDAEGSIKARVDKIVKKKTFIEHSWDAIHAVIAGMNFLLFLFPLVYSFIVTIITLIKTEAVRNDLIEAAAATGKFFVSLFKDVKKLICYVADLTQGVENHILQMILHWLIIIGMAALAAGGVGAVCFGIYKLFRFLIKDYPQVFGKFFVSAVLADLVVIVFLGELIRSVISINLFLLFIIVILGYFFARYALPIIIMLIICLLQWVWGGIEKFVRSM